MTAVDVRTHTFTDNNKTLIIWFNTSFREIRVIVLQELHVENEIPGASEQNCVSLDTELVEVKFSKNKDFITLNVNPRCARVTVLVTRLDKNKNIKQSWTFVNTSNLVNTSNSNLVNTSGILEMGLATLLKNGLTIGNANANANGNGRKVKEMTQIELKNENISAMIKRKS